MAHNKLNTIVEGKENGMMNLNDGFLNKLASFGYNIIRVPTTQDAVRYMDRSDRCLIVSNHMIRYGTKTGLMKRMRENHSVQNIVYIHNGLSESRN